MSDNMKKFLELVSKDEKLKQRMQSFNDMEPAAAISAGIALAKELGIELSEADFAKEESGDELNDDELDAVAGGGSADGLCVCSLAGGGGGTDRHDGDTYGCACAFYGQGGDGNADDFNCICVLGGVGTDDGVID